MDSCSQPVDTSDSTHSLTHCDLHAASSHLRRHSRQIRWDLFPNTSVKKTELYALFAVSFPVGFTVFAGLERKSVGEMYTFPSLLVSSAVSSHIHRRHKKFLVDYVRG